MSDELGPEDQPGFSEPPDDTAPRSGWSSALVFLFGLIILALLIYFGIAQGMAALVVFPGVPLVLLWFVYWFFLRRLLRMRRIRQAEERRLLREAAQRRSER